MSTKENQDLTGQVFGWLVVLERYEDMYDKNGKAIKQWKCQCKCGNECIKRENSLKTAKSKGSISKCDDCNSMVKDLTGKRFGKLLVLYQADKPENAESGSYWRCKCDCGNEKTINRRRLRVANSCGKCLAEDLSGQVFGNLTVIDRNYDNTKLQDIRWNCKCKCGGTKIAYGKLLKNGSTTHCGCIRNRIRFNTYDLESQEYGIGYTEKGEEFWFDKEDYELIKDYYWSYNQTGYLRGKIKGRYILLHRLVMNLAYETRPIVDHKVHDIVGKHKYDNRKCNLRIVTESQNAMNAHKSKRNKSGTTGVCWDSNNQVWRAYIGINGKTHLLGKYPFEEKDKAIQTRKKAEERFFGEYSFDNSKKIENM